MMTLILIFFDNLFSALRKTPAIGVSSAFGGVLISIVGSAVLGLQILSLTLGSILAGLSIYILYRDKLFLKNKDEDEAEESEAENLNQPNNTIT